MDMSYQPSDPLYTRFGGLELTGAFVDESNENQEKAIEILKTRMGRCKNKEYGIAPTLLETFNPSKDHVYKRYYRLWKDKKLPSHRIFIPALATDNPYLDPSYIEQLKNIGDKITKERLLYGNFEYDDDETRLFNYDAILGVFNDQFLRGNIRQQYLTCDVARFGDDKTVIIHWSNLFIQKIYTYDKTDMVFIEKKLNELASILSIPRSRIVIDEDGIGGGVVDHLSGVKGFVNNSKPIEMSEIYKNLHNYQNLKSQCYFKLAEYVNNGQIGCYEDLNEDTKNLIIEDLEQMKCKNFDQEKKLAVISKEEIKEILGRSTDVGDAIMMRMLFELSEPYKPLLA